jgi:hypothetical protein
MRAERTNGATLLRAVSSHSFQVVFWYRGTIPDGVNAQAGFSCDEWLLDDAADIREVLAWADNHDGHADVVTIAALAEIDGNTALVRIVGDDPTEGISVELVARDL